MAHSLDIRPFEPRDQAGVKELFLSVSEDLYPPGRGDELAEFQRRTLDVELGDVPLYFDGKQGWFYVAYQGDLLSGMYGLQRINETVLELRSMCVSLQHRKAGFGRALLDDAVNKARSKGFTRLTLSTSLLEGATPTLLRASGFIEVSTIPAQPAARNAYVPHIRRHHFEKPV